VARTLGDDDVLAKDGDASMIGVGLRAGAIAVVVGEEPDA
jgi:hypothetical protein